MGKITGLEDIHQVPPKVCRMYNAVAEILGDGADVSNIRVSTITEKAGIGKGTAYEYFNSKDEIVTCAIVYHMKRIFGCLAESLEKKDNFREQMDFLLEEIERRNRFKYDFLRFVHLMSDNSAINRMVREKMSLEAFAPYRPANVFGKILRGGMERGELRKDLPLDYMLLTIFSRLLSYMIAVTAQDCFRVDTSAMRPLIYQGIADEMCVRG